MITGSLLLEQQQSHDHEPGEARRQHGTRAGLGVHAPSAQVGGWPQVPRHGKLRSMTDSGSAFSPGAVASSTDPACDVAHGHAEAPVTARTLIAVFASPVAGFLLAYARDTGFSPVLVEPDPEHALAGFTAVRTLDGLADRGTDVVVTDHHRPELGAVLRDALASPARWVGVMGNPRHPAPHIPALTALGVPAGEIARVHRPIGLNIGSQTPAEIALATVAGLIADRNGRPGGFEF
jgi:xanthine/CO dehydrogenase XdhC/CoxF family maturation factor